MSKDITDNSKFSINGIGYEQANGQKDGYDDDDDDDDATYGPYASFDQSGSLVFVYFPSKRNSKQGFFKYFKS